MSGHARLPKDDYTVVENYFFDHVMPRVSPAEWKIICAVIRETVGWECDVSAHRKCRRADAEISIDRFTALTGLASQAVVAAIKRACQRTVVHRYSQQTGRQRTFRYSAASRANLKELKRQDPCAQDPLPFASDGENQNPSPMVNTEIPKAVWDGENQNPSGSVLRSRKKDLDLNKHTSSAPSSPDSGVCVELELITEERYDAYADAHDLGGGWVTVAKRTRDWDRRIVKWEEEEARRLKRQAERDATAAACRAREHEELLREIREAEERARLRQEASAQVEKPEVPTETEDQRRIREAENQAAIERGLKHSEVLRRKLAS